jgi:hypothetical protein
MMEVLKFSPPWGHRNKFDDHKEFPYEIILPLNCFIKPWMLRSVFFLNIDPVK